MYDPSTQLSQAVTIIFYPLILFRLCTAQCRNRAVYSSLMVLVDNQPNLPSDLVREASVPPSQVPTTSAEWQNLGKLVQLLRTSSFAETFVAEMGIGFWFYPYIDFCLWPLWKRYAYICTYITCMQSMRRSRHERRDDSIEHHARRSFRASAPGATLTHLHRSHPNANLPECDICYECMRCGVHGVCVCVTCIFLQINTSAVSGALSSLCFVVPSYHPPCST